MNRYVLGKNIDVFPQNGTFFLKILINDNLKNRYHSKIILGHAVFQKLLKSTFSLKKSLPLNISIR